MPVMASLLLYIRLLSDHIVPVVLFDGFPLVSRLFFRFYCTLTNVGRRPVRHRLFQTLAR